MSRKGGATYKLVWTESPNYINAWPASLHQLHDSTGWLHAQAVIA